MIGLKQRKVKGIILKIRFIRGWLVVVLIVFWVLSLVLLIISYQLNEITQYLLLLMAACFIFIISIDTFNQYSLYQQYQRGQLKTKNILIHSLLRDQQQLQTKLVNVEKSNEAIQQQILEHYTMWAHQIKTPITALSLLQEDLPAYELRMKHRLELSRIESNVNQMISYVRLQSIQNDLILKPVNVGIITQEVLKKYAVFFMFQSKQLELDSFDFDYVSDPKWLSLLIDQLISNAVKYAHKKVTIYFDYPCLYIVDDGPGMDQVDLKGITQIGFTGDTGRLHSKSTGIGLYLATQIAKQLGVVLHFENNEPKGLIARIEFKQKTTLNDKFVSSM